MNTCPSCGKMTGLHGSILQGCTCQWSMQAPPKRAVAEPHKWVGLTDEERGQAINANFGTGLWSMAKDIEAKLKEKNGF